MSLVEDFQSLELHLPHNLYERWVKRLARVESPPDSISVAERAMDDVVSLVEEVGRLVKQANQLLVQIEEKKDKDALEQLRLEALSIRNKELEERLANLRSVVETAYHHLEYGTKSARRILEEGRE